MKDEEIRHLSSTLVDLPKKSRAALLRPILPEIQKKMQSGVAAQSIVNELNTQGIKITAKALYQELYRWRRRDAASGSRAKSQGASESARVGVSSRLSRSPSIANTVVPSEPLQTKGDLRKLREQPVDLDHYARLGKTLKDK